MTESSGVNGYNRKVVDLFEHTPYAGQMEQGPGIFAGVAGSQAGGTEVRFWVKAGEGRIQAVSFQAFGCPHTIAAASWIAHHARGLPLEDVATTVWLEVERALHVPAQKRGRLLIVEDALKAAVNAATRNV